MKNENVFIGGAVFAAIASSLCCVLPLVAVVFGLGAFGAASAFKTLRPYLLVLVFAALAFSFYRVYFRREDCAEGDACATKPVSKINQLFLWGGVLVILTFALAPYYTGYLAAAAYQPRQPLAAPEMPAAAETESLADKTVVIDVEGMTCEGCAAHINETLKKLNGVVSAVANYPKKNVKVVFNPKQITLEQIKKAIDEIGYKAK
ncbi:MAG TPA: mercuric transporter MerT family protein [Pyrinomonadaceae bacterium]|jgi:copper chaperone CopZ|nr:mercuric transporter MerT family protein [Pyrinomonadaceae bacterium]